LALRNVADLRNRDKIAHLATILRAKEPARTLNRSLNLIHNLNRHYDSALPLP
jgi:hypothetical protein